MDHLNGTHTLWLTEIKTLCDSAAAVLWGVIIASVG